MIVQPEMFGGVQLTTTNMAEAGWKSAGQFYWDLRRWDRGEPTEMTDRQTEFIVGLKRRRR